MPMRLELGLVKLEVERQEDAAAFLRGLLRYLNNLELAAVLGVTDKTVRRWKREGRLPTREGGQIMLLDLLYHLAPPAGPVRPSRRRGAVESVGAGEWAGRTLPRPAGEARPAERGPGAGAASRRSPRLRPPQPPAAPPSDPGSSQ